MSIIAAALAVTLTVPDGDAVARQEPTTPSEVAIKPTLEKSTGVRAYLNLAYRDGDGAHPTKHRLDLYLPAPDKWRTGRPLLIWIHGGGWSFGDKNDAFDLYSRYCLMLAREGVAAANISYRLSPQFKHPSHIEDVAAATAWLVRHAEHFGFDPNALFVSGHSAGGHLSALLATESQWLRKHEVPSDAIAGAIPSSGVFDLRPLMQSSARWQRAFAPEDAESASPVNHVDAGDPPFALIVEERGEYLRSQTQAMADALEAVGRPPQVAEVPRANHITMLRDLASKDGVHLRTTLGFIDRVLEARRAKEAEQKDGDSRAGSPDGE